MRLIIFGASGTVGSQLVAQALDQGHQVTAFARQPDALELNHANLRCRAGDVLDQGAVRDAVSGHDAVIIALGAGRKGNVRSTGTRNILAAMQHQGVLRLICLSTIGAGDSHSLLNFFWKRIMFGILLKDAMVDHEAQETLIRQSDSEIEWIIVRPGSFTNGPATGQFQHGDLSENKKLALKVSRADIASFMLQQLTSDVYLRQSPVVSY
ncbi:MAG: SDR family oxidoreductase [Granulosicoccus sp.]